MSLVKTLEAMRALGRNEMKKNTVETLDDLEANLRPKEPSKEFRLTHLNGALLQVPVYEPHYRGTNYLAIIDVDGTAPGGLSRRFLQRGKGESFYLIEQLSLFDAVEFGADYTTSVGAKKRLRCYGFVAAITEMEIVIRSFDSGATACVAAKIARTSPADRKRALGEARDALIEKAAKVQDEIDALNGDKQ